MSPNEYSYWADQISRYPPGDYLTHILLANLCAITTNVNTDSKKVLRPASLFDFAPWLLNLEGKRTEEYIENIQKASTLKKQSHASIVEEAYMRKKLREAELENA